MVNVWNTTEEKFIIFIKKLPWRNGCKLVEIVGAKVDQARIASPLLLSMLFSYFFGMINESKSDYGQGSFAPHSQNHPQNQYCQIILLIKVNVMIIIQDLLEQFQPFQFLCFSNSHPLPWKWRWNAWSYLWRWRVKTLEELSSPTKHCWLHKRGNTLQFFKD